MAYSAVTQPLPFPTIQRGTPFVNDAVHNTFVRPNEISAEPSACSLQPRSIVISRKSSVARPSARATASVTSILLGCRVADRGDP